jgi:hypothetical protein
VDDGGGGGGGELSGGGGGYDHRYVQGKKNETEARTSKSQNSLPPLT